MVYLVTGSRGYIGSKLCQRMKEENIKFIEHDLILGDDILDRERLTGISKDVDAIIHLAGAVGLDKCKNDPNATFSVNVLGTANVALCGKPIVFTGALTGYSRKGVVDETTPILAKSEYYIQKSIAEQIVLSRGGVVLRLGSLYGVSPNMRWDLLVNSFVKEAVLKKKIKLFQPDMMRPISNIDDVCNAIMVFVSNYEILDKLHGIYNVVSVNTKKRNIVSKISKITDCETELINDADPENRNYSVSTKKIRSLDFEFYPNLSGSIQEIAAQVI
jgi:nucleoside-diphosphate-sugar epimerase